MAEATDGAVKWAAGGPFAITPIWVLEADISDRAARLYGVLSRLANNETQATTMPRKQLAAKIHCSPSTLDLAVRELRDLGAISVEAQFAGQGDRTANRYRVHIVPLEPEGSAAPSVDPSMEESVGNKSETSKSEIESPLAGTLPRAVPPPIRLVGKQNLPLNALMEVCGVDPGNRQRVRWAVAALNGKAGEQGIRDLFWLEATRYAEGHGIGERLDELHDQPDKFSAALVAAIERKARKYREQMGGARLTPTALRNWWLDLELQAQRADGGLTPEEMRSFVG